MASPVYIKDSSGFRIHNGFYVKVDDAWKQGKVAYVKVDGVWRHYHEYTTSTTSPT